MFLNHPSSGQEFSRKIKINLLEGILLAGFIHCVVREVLSTTSLTLMFIADKVRLSMSVVIYVLIVCEIGKESEIRGELEKIRGVTEARTVYGEYDVVARLETQSLRELDEIVTNIRKIPGIVRTITLISA
ncbi:MAG: Lrp/AsnC ligand binding domain-containing protein [Candidatus Bathyarchaeota archaeon]|nr:Lrp/AsnC ligand binding domain-containing protein [Candidatus Bathyarchaeota archaeon]